MIPLKSLVPEQIEASNEKILEKEAKAFAKRLLHNGALISKNNPMSASAGENPTDYSEELGQIIKNAITRWISVQNSRGGR